MTLRLMEVVDYNGGRSGGAQGSGGSPSFRDETSRRGYEEYDAGDDETVKRSNSLPTRRSLAAGSSSSATAPNRAPPRIPRTAVMVSQATPPSSAAQEVDLLGGFGDDVPTPAPTPAATLESAKVSLDGLYSARSTVKSFSNPFVDDFDDFQSAPPPVSAPIQATVGFTPAPVGPKPASNVFDLLRQTKPAISAVPTTLPQYSAGTPAFSGPQAQPTVVRPNYGPSSSNPFGVLSPSTSGTPAVAASTSVTSPKSSSNFDDLWSISMGANASASKPSASGPAGAGKSIKDLEREKAMAGMWGSAPPAGSAGTRAFGTTAASNTGFGTGGGDDLLL
jgi:epsin